MQSLERLLAKLAKRTNARWWAGRRPEVRDGQLAMTIAGLVSYPTATDFPFSEKHLVRLTWSQAAHVLALAGTTSLAYGPPAPRRGAVEEAAEALKELGHDAAFFSNGLWNLQANRAWNPLTSATFDCGLIGYDAENAFIFWVEEED